MRVERDDDEFHSKNLLLDVPIFTSIHFESRLFVYLFLLFLYSYFYIKIIGFINFSIEKLIPWKCD